MSLSSSRLHDLTLAISPDLPLTSFSYSVLYNGSIEAGTLELANSSSPRAYAAIDVTSSPAKQYLGLVTSRALTIGLLCLFIVRTVTIAVYRLWFHPYAKYPGPKLLGLTKYAEFYYDLFDKDGFTPYIERLHEQYGPIVRCGPDEVSINDKDFQLEHFSNDQNQVKGPWFYNFGFLNALALVTDKAKHWERKKYVLHLLSTSGFYFKGFYPMFESRISAFNQLLEHSLQADSSLNISLAYRKMANAVMREILLGDTAWASADLDDDAPYILQPLFQSMSVLRHFKFLQPAFDLLPTWAEAYFPMALYTRAAEHHIGALATQYTHMTPDQRAALASPQQPLLYALLEHSPLYATGRFRPAIEEFLELLWGGREAIGGLLTTITYHLLDNPAAMATLHAELSHAQRTLLVDLERASFAQLQRLPYLNAVCKEGLRLTEGNYLRMPRVSSVPVRYGAEVLPEGLAVSWSTAWNHHNEAIYDRAREFVPERWLGPDKEAVARLEHYFRPWGHGQRACAGRAVAYEIIWRTVARVFARYRLAWSEDGLGSEGVREGGALKVFPKPGTPGVVIAVERFED
jgi:hypothetical protein